MPWTLFLALARRVRQFDARALLRIMDGTNYAVQGLLGADHAALQREQVDAMATGRPVPRFALEQSTRVEPP